ncbi:MAG: hypothetical protein Q8K93_23005, partial [Reyranella sp.]|nr:hypothetical protein [Reyranella sp.]
MTSSTADGLEAGSAGGAIIVTNNALVTANSGYGVTTANSGAAGTTTVNANANVTSGGTVAGLAAIRTATTGSGATTVNVGNGVTISGGAGSAIRTTGAAGPVTLNLGTGGAASTVTSLGGGASSWVIDLANSGAGVSTVNVGATTTVRSSDNTVTGYDDLAIRGVGGSVVINNAGRINGVVNFSGLTGNVVFNNTSGLSWHTTGASTFSAGADTLNNSASGAIFTNAGGAATSWDFGAGADTLINAGLLVVGEPAQAAATLTISNLEAWNNSGKVAFGSSSTTYATAASDGQINDRIMAAGAT